MYSYECGVAEVQRLLSGLGVVEHEVPAGVLVQVLFVCAQERGDGKLKKARRKLTQPFTGWLVAWLIPDIQYIL